MPKGGDDGSIFFSGGELIDISSSQWQKLPTEALKALLAQRQTGGDRPTCGSDEQTHHYNTALHVFALFLILFLSTAGTRYRSRFL
jgi:hypothetical protein